MPIPSAAPATPPAVSEFAETAALISQITAEARASGQSITFDPEAPPEADEGDAPAAPQKVPAKTPAKAAPKGTETESNASEDTEDEAEGEDGASENEEQDQAEEPQGTGSLDLDAVRAALAAEGGVDMLALAKALGKELEELGVTPGASKFLRLETRKNRETLQKAQEMAQRLERDYGDQVKAREAAQNGELQPAVDFIERTFGMPWNDLNKMVAQLLQGRPIKELEKNRELFLLRKKEADRAAAEKATSDKAASEKKVADAKVWIKNQIKGDKLASVDLERQLKEAGFPSVVDLVFEELQAGYKQGLTDPKKALDKVRGKLSRQAKALRSAGLVPKAPASKPAPVSASKPRANAQAGAAGNGRPMTDQEIREAVLREAGLWRN